MLRESVASVAASGAPTRAYADLTRGNPMLQRARALLRRRPAPHRSRRQQASRSRRCGRALARAAGREQARAVFAEPRAAAPGDNVALVITDELSRPLAALCAGPWARSTTRVGGDAGRRAACSSTARAGRDDEMIALGTVAQARARHGPSAAERRRAECSSGSTGCRRRTRKVLIHVNNTNPILDEDSPSAPSSRAAASKSRATAWRSSCERRAWTRAGVRGASCASAGRAYHIHHPFNVMLNTGRASPAQIRGWVANRFYYQISIPIKDAAILAQLPGSRACAAAGCSASSITTATATTPAASTPGCAWPRRWA